MAKTYADLVEKYKPKRSETGQFQPKVNLKEVEAFMRANPEAKYIDVANKFGISTSSAMRMARKLGIRKYKQQEPKHDTEGMPIITRVGNVTTHRLFTRG